MAKRVEIADHVVPGLTVIAVGLLALFVVSRLASGDGLMAFGGAVIALAGMWMTATHLPLVSQARRHQVAWAPTIFHTAPGLVVLGLGVLWTMLFLAASDPAKRVQSSPQDGE